jgi:o-succinylbenzoate---CoA ligase
MTQPTYNKVHNLFKLNGFHFDRDDMLRVAYSYIKEGEAYEQPVGKFFLDWFDDNSFMYLQTSGTTGAPKTIKIEKQAMVYSALATGDYFDLSPGDKVLHCLPVQYIAGKMMFVRAFILGLDIEFVAPSANPLHKNEYKYDFAAMVPLQAQNSIKALVDVKKMIIGGAAMSTNLENQLAKIKTQVFETYGMTETITHIAAKRVGEKAFTVLPGVTISYDDKNCLVIHAPKISDDVIVTNDLVELVNENQFVFLGRLDNVINSGGIKLIPEQIESKLSSHIKNRFFVTGIPDEKLGEKLILVIEGEKYSIDETIFNDFDKYQKPKEIRFVSKFKETENGKILRKESLN